MAKKQAQTNCVFETNLDGNSWGGTRRLFATSPYGNRPATLDGTFNNSLDGDQHAEHGHSSSGDLFAAAAPFLPNDLAGEPVFSMTWTSSASSRTARAGTSNGPRVIDHIS
jgi:hypothetical protein